MAGRLRGAAVFPAFTYTSNEGRRNRPASGTQGRRHRVGVHGDQAPARNLSRRNTRRLSSLSSVNASPSPSCGSGAIGTDQRSSSFRFFASVQVSTVTRGHESLCPYIGQGTRRRRTSFGIFAHSAAMRNKRLHWRPRQTNDVAFTVSYDRRRPARGVLRSARSGSSIRSERVRSRKECNARHPRAPLVRPYSVALQTCSGFAGW